MNVLVLTIGTRGDVQPHVALGHGLSKRGHAVTVCTSPRYRDAIERLGLGYEPLSDDIIAMVESAEGRAAIGKMSRPVSGVKALVEVGRKSGQIQRDLVADGWAAAESVQPDLIVYHPKMSAAVHFAEKLGVRAVMAPLFPMFLPTSAYPNPGLPVLGRGAVARAYNRGSHRFVLGLASRFGNRMFRSWRADHGLPRLPRGADAVHTQAGDRIPILNGWSRHVAPDPPDWPGDVHTTGYWFLDRLDDWQPPDRLAAFLDDGPPPVYVGFGSMAGRRPGKTTRIVLDALAHTGQRGVLARGWGGLEADDLPASVYLLDAVPHDWLFPRVAAVVHHGGAGSTAAGLRAGRPTVVCPFFGDQGFWGRRVEALGVGPAPIPQRSLTSDGLAAALSEAIRPSAQRAASALGDRIRQEDGVARAAEVLERLCDSSRPLHVSSPVSA